MPYIVSREETIVKETYFIGPDSEPYYRRRYRRTTTTTTTEQPEAHSTSSGQRKLMNDLVKFAWQSLLALVGAFIVNSATEAVESKPTPQPPAATSASTASVVGVFDLSVLLLLCSGLCDTILRGRLHACRWNILPPLALYCLSATSALICVAYMVTGARFWSFKKDGK